MIYIDCDGFKNVNDRLGHQTGDQVLRSLAVALQNNTRTTDFVARLGGDEFAILMTETGEQIIAEALKRLHALLTDALVGNGWPVTLSMGAAIYLQPPESAGEMIKNADYLMFKAKNEGKNMVQYKIFENSTEDLQLPHSQNALPPSSLEVPTHQHNPPL